MKKLSKAAFLARLSAQLPPFLLERLGVIPCDCRAPHCEGWQLDIENVPFLQPEEVIAWQRWLEGQP